MKSFKTKLEFDDIVEDKDGTLWTQVCEKHSKLLEPNKLEKCSVSGLVCGVEGCNEEAAYYYTIKEGK